MLTVCQPERLHLVRGMVEDTFEKNCPEKLALLRLDTDWYASTKIALEIGWPRLSKGGILIIDDWGHYLGQRKAANEFFANKAVRLSRVDYSCRTITKM